MAIHGYEWDDLGFECQAQGHVLDFEIDIYEPEL